MDIKVGKLEGYDRIVTQSDLQQCLQLLELIRTQVFPNDNSPDQPRDLHIVIVQEMIQFELNRMEKELADHDFKKNVNYKDLAQQLIMIQMGKGSEVL